MANTDTTVRTILVVLGAILLLPFLMMLFFVPMMGIWGGGHMWDSGMWGAGSGAPWMWIVMWIVPLVILGGLGYFLYRALRRSGDRELDSAIQELRSAYARGELSDEEYEKRRERLQRDR